MKFLKIFLYVSLVFVINSSQAQDLPKVYTEKISVEDLHQDLQTLKENLELVHIGLYEYNSKATLDKAFASIKNTIDQPITVVEFYRQLLPLHPIIANGHTAIVRSEAMAKAARGNIKYMPFSTYWDRDSLFITKNYSADESIASRTFIKTINGKSSKDLFNQMVNLMTRDGQNKTAPISKINYSFAGWYINVLGNPESYDLELVEPNGTERSVTIAASTLKERNEIKLKRYGLDKPSFWQSDEKALTLKIEGKVATMVIRTFGNSFVKKKKKQHFKKFYQDAFEKIEAAGVEHLIIDLRDNGGGDPKPTIWLIAHLLDKPFTFYKDVTALCDKIPNSHLYAKGVKTESFLNKLATKKRGELYTINDNLLTRIAGMGGLRETKPMKTVYKNEVYVLINGDSFSATGEVSAMIKEHNLATFIGEETGGNPNQNVSGIQLMMTLPNSKVRIMMPFWLWEMNVTYENTGRGVIPDHIVRNTIDDELNDRDAVMKYTLDLINKR